MSTHLLLMSGFSREASYSAIIAALHAGQHSKGCMRTTSFGGASAHPSSRPLVGGHRSRCVLTLIIPRHLSQV